MWRVERRPKGNRGTFVVVFERRGVKVNADKSKDMVVGGMKGLGCEIRVDGVRLGHV